MNPVRYRKDKSKPTSIFTSKTCPDSSLSFPGSLFPPFTSDPSHTSPVAGPQTELPPDPGFLLSIPMPTDLPYALLAQILSMAC